MTIKEAFGMLFKAVKKSGLNPFFLINNLKDTFEDVAANVVDAGGSVVEVEPLYTEGIPIADISVDGDISRLYTPYVTTIDLYSNVEHKAGVWYHDGIAEDVWERFYVKDNISFSNHFFTIDSEMKFSKYLILDSGGFIRTVNNTCASLSGIPGIISWSYNINQDDISGLGIYSLNDAQDIIGGTCYCTVRYVKRT